MSLAGTVANTGPHGDGLVRALNSLSYGAREKSRTWRAGHAELGLINEGHGEQFGDSLVVWDGRIDNRADLIAALGQQNTAPSDAGLLWLAWRRWSDDFLNHVYGEFSCAVWDAERGELALGRDILGTRSLFFWLGDREILFASEARGLWSDDRVKKAVNESRIVQWLNLAQFEDAQTLYRDVLRVMPGHVAVWNGAEVRHHRYWRPETLPLVSLPSDEAYVETLRAKFEAAVRRRIPASGEVGCQLSGGLDSSAVTVFAARHLASQKRRLTAFTAAPRRPFDPRLAEGRIGDEFANAASIASLYPNIDHVRVDNDSVPVMVALQRRSSASDAPVLNPINAPWVSGIEQEARRRGVQVLLTGDMGNASFSYEGWLLLPQLLKRGQWLRLLRTWLEVRRGPDHKSWISLASLTLTPALSWALRQRIRGWFGRKDLEVGDFSAINPQFAADHGVARKDLSPGDPRRFSDGRLRRIAILQKFDNHAGYYGATRRLSGIAMADPTADRELLEYCLCVPEDQYLHKGEVRSLARRLLSGLMPAAVISERRKGLQAVDWPETLADTRAELVEAVASLERSPLASKCLDLPRLRRLMDEWPQDGWHRHEVHNDYMLTLSRGLATGDFIRRIEGRND